MSKGYDGWQNDYFDPEDIEDDSCPNCGNCNWSEDRNEFGDLVFRCGDCGYSETIHIDDESPVIVELSEF